MKFYDTICAVLFVKLPNFRNGSAKDFYSTNLYKNIAICINIVEDTSDHITIHKAKGSGYENVKLLSKPTSTQTKNIIKTEQQQEYITKEIIETKNNDYYELLLRFESFENIQDYIEKRLADCDGTLKAEDVRIYTEILTKVSTPLENWESISQEEFFDRIIIKFVSCHSHFIPFETWSSTNELS